MSRKSTRRKCRCCRKFFFPDYRNAQRQEFCKQPECRRASKGASQRRWSGKKANRDYFRGPEHVRRVQQWRKAHPGYWRKQKAGSGGSQPIEPESVNPEQRSCNVRARDEGTLQDLCLVEHPVLVGLISMITGSTLQEDIVATSRKLILRGSNILGLKIRDADQTTSSPASYDPQTIDPPGPASPSAAQLQLG